MTSTEALLSPYLLPSVCNEPKHSPHTPLKLPRYLRAAQPSHPTTSLHFMDYPLPTPVMGDTAQNRSNFVCVSMHRRLWNSKERVKSKHFTAELFGCPLVQAMKAIRLNSFCCTIFSLHRITAALICCHWSTGTGRGLFISTAKVLSVVMFLANLVFAPGPGELERSWKHANKCFCSCGQSCLLAPDLHSHTVCYCFPFIASCHSLCQSLIRTTSFHRLISHFSKFLTLYNERERLKGVDWKERERHRAQGRGREDKMYVHVWWGQQYEMQNIGLRPMQIIRKLLSPTHEVKVNCTWKIDRAVHVVQNNHMWMYECACVFMYQAPEVSSKDQFTVSKYNKKTQITRFHKGMAVSMFLTHYLT